jgi:5-methyltetrahydropteroyltriglutamate--homocysteine methyltransferase
MRRSTDRILSTHVGSLARPHDLLEMMREKEHGRAYDPDAFARSVRDAVGDVVRRQVEAGLDVVTDGEQGKVSFLTYVKERLAGFDQVEGETLLPPSWQKEIDDFPGYYREYLGKYSSTVAPMRVMVCTGPVSYIGEQAVATDIANLRAALAALQPSPYGRRGYLSGQESAAFLPSTSPSGFGRNEYYATEHDYLAAVAEAMRAEYLAIVESGFLLQVDDPWLIEILTDDGRADPAERRRRAHEHVEVLNHALRGIPEDRIRLHTCYGLNHGPRLRDLPLAEVVPVMLTINAGAYSFEVANPRHQHEWRIWADVTLPEGKILLPGLLGHATNYVEHPELIADGICQYASLVGRENVIASADCGFSSRATFAPEVHPTVVWAKFAALAEGAAIATKRLWGAEAPAVGSSFRPRK